MLDNALVLNFFIRFRFLIFVRCSAGAKKFTWRFRRARGARGTPRNYRPLVSDRQESSFWTEDGMKRRYNSSCCSDSANCFGSSADRSLNIELFLFYCICIGPNEEVKRAKEAMLKRFECDVVGDLTEYLGCVSTDKFRACLYCMLPHPKLRHSRSTLIFVSSNTVEAYKAHSKVSLIEGQSLEAKRKRHHSSPLKVVKAMVT